jgi:hypothetical protein
MVRKNRNMEAAVALRLTGIALIACVLVSSFSALAGGTWTALVRNAPDTVNLMLLLSDGTVMVANKGGSAWYRLTPDIHGSYVNGIWTDLAWMHNTRWWYSSAVLQDGRVFVAGGEGGNGGTTAEVYDPLNNTWTMAPASGQNFIDSSSKVLPNGNVLVAPVLADPFSSTIIYDPRMNTWSATTPTLAWQAEATWVKLPDDSILTADPDSMTSERYIPALNMWVNDGPIPVSLYAVLPGFVGEIGAAFLLSDGRAFFLGGRGQTALYTPTGTTNAGTWVRGPDIPNGLVAADAPAAMMVNGKILCAVASPPYVSGNTVVFPPPTSFFEYDNTIGPTGAFTQVTAPGGTTDDISSYKTMMLDLPDGTVLYSHYGSKLHVYRPDGVPLASGKPTITSINQMGDGSYHLIGTGLNGISEGAAYGDENQMDSNYPLVRLSDFNGHVYYARTYNWSSTSVMTGSRPVTTEFTLPADLAAGSYSLVAIANGIASDPVSFSGPVWVDFSYTGVLQFGTYPFPYKTMAQGTQAVTAGGRICIKSGISHETLTVSKAMSITAIGGPATIGR